MSDGASITTQVVKEMGQLKLEHWAIDKVTPYDKNPRTIGKAAVSKVAASIREFGFNVPIIVDEAGIILAGHTRRLALLQLGVKVASVIVKRGLSEAKKKAWRIADNRVAEESEWDVEKLKAEMEELAAFDFDLAALGFDDGELDKMAAELAGDAEAAETEVAKSKPLKTKANGSLAERFGVPPFSVLNAREGWWQDRKRLWLAIGLDRLAGRAGAVMKSKGAVDAVSVTMEAKSNGTSSFDPVLCELVYRWFCPPGGVVIDPFAGGPTSGIVASHLGRQFHGIDVRPEQVAGCNSQLDLAGDPAPMWYTGDSRQLEEILPTPILADLIFTCPPYADLEVYSEDPQDVSTMSWFEFAKAYAKVMEAAAARLKPGRFCVVVIGDARGKDGNYYGLPEKTVEICEAAGLRKYNEAVLLTPPGSAPMRSGAPFEGSRKLAKVHQNVLVFVKGDAKVAASAIGPCEFGDGPEVSVD